MVQAVEYITFTLQSDVRGCGVHERRQITKTYELTGGMKREDSGTGKEAGPHGGPEKLFTCQQVTQYDTCGGCNGQAA